MARKGPTERRECSGTLNWAMFVKICGTTSEDDALLAVAMGADAARLRVRPAPRQIAPQAAYDIVRRLPPGVMTVGVFRDEHPDRVVEIVHGARLKAAQLHGHETPADAELVRRKVGYLIKAFPAGSDELARAGDYGADVVMLDAPSPGSGTTFDWSLADGVPQGSAAAGRRPHPRQRGQRHHQGPPVGGRRVDRRRARARPEGPAQAEGLRRRRQGGGSGQVPRS